MSADWSKGLKEKFDAVPNRPGTVKAAFTCHECGLTAEVVHVENRKEGEDIIELGRSRSKIWRRLSNTGPTSSTHAAAVTPSNTADLAQLTKGVWVGTHGNLKVTMAGGETVTFLAVADGTYLPICVSRIWADSTASNIVALWE